jgi:type IV pilus assembly protein PilM
MARSGTVWGIDVGQCALKAMRCRPHESEDKIVVDAFDYIEYPKILTQPDANPAELVSEALKQFLSRNQVHNDRVAVSVAGQSGLARFIKLPPVEAKKIPDIVRYEARQQIPFDLNDVIWDYQRMGGGSEEQGFVLETEIGLFAMKRDAVFRALKPFVDAGIEVDIVQLAPLALYNYVVFDMLPKLPSPEEYDPDDPPESIVLVSLGTDATDLVVTNGFKVWQRSVPLGGNHFTKLLTKEMKLTFAKAEHLKRNATTAQDPKAVFQAMRPVFNDLQTELQRSLGYFTNLDRTAKIGRVVAVGNAFKLPGLRRYLAQSLGFEIERVDAFRGLVGPEVLATPAFKDNILSFGVCYGLCLQGLQSGGLRTNLLPREISMDRLIRRKKPWAVAAAAGVMLACTISYTAYALQFNAVKPSLWDGAIQKADSVQGESKRLQGEYEAAKTKFDATKGKGERLVSNVQDRDRWLKFLTALNECLPPYPGKGGKIVVEPPPSATDEKELKTQIMKRNQLIVTNIDSQQVDDVSKWFAVMKDKQWYRPIPGKPGAPDPGGTPAAAAVGAAAATAPSDGPTGPGTIVQIYGRHFHNDPNGVAGAAYVYNTLLSALASQKMLDLGVSFPVLIKPETIDYEEIIIPGPKHDNGNAPGGVVGGPMIGPMGPGMDASGADSGEKHVTVHRFKFRVQFVWQPDKAAGKVSVPAKSTPAAPATPATPAGAPVTAPPAVPASPAAVAPATPPAATPATPPAATPATPPAATPINPPPAAPGRKPAPAAGPAAKLP